MSQFLRKSAENGACRSPAWCRTVDTHARARSDEQKGITPCSTLKANPPASGLDRLCYKNGPFVSSGRNGSSSGSTHWKSALLKRSGGAAHKALLWEIGNASSVAARSAALVVCGDRIRARQFWRWASLEMTVPPPAHRHGVITDGAAGAFALVRLGFIRKLRNFCDLLQRG
jgi:hypothetical protein